MVDAVVFAQLRFPSHFHDFVSFNYAIICSSFQCLRFVVIVFQFHRHMDERSAVLNYQSTFSIDLAIMLETNLVQSHLLDAFPDLDVSDVRFVIFFKSHSFFK